MIYVSFKLRENQIRCIKCTLRSRFQKAEFEYRLRKIYYRNVSCMWLSFVYVFVVSVRKLTASYSIERKVYVIVNHSIAYRFSLGDSLEKRKCTIALTVDTDKEIRSQHRTFLFSRSTGDVCFWTKSIAKLYTR